MPPRAYLDPPAMQTGVDLSAVTDGQAVASPDIPRMRPGFLYWTTNGDAVLIVRDGSGTLRYRVWSASDPLPWTPEEIAEIDALLAQFATGGTLITTTQVEALQGLVSLVDVITVTSNPGAHSVTLDLFGINYASTPLSCVLDVVVEGDATTGDCGITTTVGTAVLPMQPTPSTPVSTPQSGRYATENVSGFHVRMTIQGAAAGTALLTVSCGGKFATRTVSVP